MRLVDADTLIKKATLNDLKFYVENNIPLVPIVEIMNSKTIDPINHGRWLHNYGDGYHCSCCEAPLDQYFDNYCCRCGAKMDGE